MLLIKSNKLILKWIPRLSDTLAASNSALTLYGAHKELYTSCGCLTQDCLTCKKRTRVAYSGSSKDDTGSEKACHRRLTSSRVVTSRSAIRRVRTAATSEARAAFLDTSAAAAEATSAATAASGAFGSCNRRTRVMSSTGCCGPPDPPDPHNPCRTDDQPRL